MTSNNQKIYVSNTFNDHPCSKQILKKVKTAIKYFPEITKPIILLRFGHKKGAYPVAWVKSCVKSDGISNFEIGFNIAYNPSMVTIFHELGHILRCFIPDVMPKGEESASIYAISRIPGNLIDSCNIPYIGLVPITKVNYYCKLALKMRDINKDIDYIKWIINLINQERGWWWPQYDIYNEIIIPSLI